MTGEWWRFKRWWLAGVAVAFITFVLWRPPALAPVALDWLLGRVFQETTSPEALAVKYEESRLKILLVPGHDNEFSGALVAGLREADLNLELAGRLADLFSADDKFEVILARDLSTGDYTSVFRDYFATDHERIVNFVAERKSLVNAYIAAGEFVSKSSNNHSFAKPETALRLYGLNLWANEHEVDLTLHIHFNDYPGRPAVGGEYSGFSIYIPEAQYSNARASRVLAQSIFDRLDGFVAPSNHPLEVAGVIESQELIALGSNASQKGASTLIEYGYLYESQFHQAAVKPLILEELALRTYAGVKNYFDRAYPVGVRSAILPRTITAPLRRGDKGAEVLALQASLAAAQSYPPAGKNLNDCPLNGNFGPCTEVAVKTFQAESGLTPSGFVGPLTVEVLKNNLPASRS